MKKDTTATVTTPPEEVSYLFADMMRKHRKGHALDKASAKLREALIASRDTGAKSTVTVTITITPSTDGMMAINIQPTNKLPDQKLAGSVFWVDDEGNLSTTNPEQKEFEFREVPKPDVVREASEKAAKQA